MHIKEAKSQIKNAVMAYGTKDEHGKYKIPISKQRPIFLLGAPGIGKTAIVEQIAQELDLAFVSYAMTHHTRQSALGLPYMIDKDFGGKSYRVSEYTMSEILSSVYEEMEKTKKSQGILFLDEINCVSETLAPAMLQFLQYKTFGRHKVPDGWIIVTAGNPSEYNDSVKEYDIAMLDRMKKIEVEPDFDVWKEFALQTGVHPVILSYLAIKPQYFYRVTTTLDGKQFVTARGWDDLSQMIELYEENKITVDENLIGQYIQDEEITKDFTNYYDLYAKYKSDYQVEEILDGKVKEEIITRAQNAKFDERISLVSLIISTLDSKVKTLVEKEDVLRTMIPEIKMMEDDCKDAIKAKRNEYKALSEKTDTADKVLLAIQVYEKYDSLYTQIKHTEHPKEEALNLLKQEALKLKEEDNAIQQTLENVFKFFEDSFGDGQEMLILVSECTVRPAISKYIMGHGCPKYYQYNKKLLFDENRKELSERIDALNLLEMND